MPTPDSGPLLDASPVCDLSAADALGPYWTDFVPDGSMLAEPTQTGQRLVIHGQIVTADCHTPVDNRTLVFWQADDEGLYDYNHAGVHQGRGERELELSETRLRGRVVSDARGEFVVETILPREYPLNFLDPETSAFRAPHIHVLVGNEVAAPTLVTQLYFSPNDLIRSVIPEIAALNANDGSAPRALPDRFLSVETGDGEVWRAEFRLVVNA